MSGLLSWQDLVVAIILLPCAVYVLTRIYRALRNFFTEQAGENNPCKNCATGCELKNLYKKKQTSCAASRKKF